MKSIYIRNIFVIYLFIYSSLVLGGERFHFGHIKNTDGLTNSSINSICKDQRGFLWFGTYDGLNCYNGIDITQYRNSAEDSCSLSDSYIYTLCADSSGNLWVGTRRGGLNRYSGSITFSVGNN